MKFFILIFAFIFLALNSLVVSASEYSQKCRAIEDDYLQFNVNSDLKINSPFVFKVTVFEDEKCQTPYLIFTRYFKIYSQENEKIDLKTEKVTYTVLSREVADALNSTGFCGNKKWKAHVETDVTGKKCDDYQQLAANDLYFQLLTTSNNILKFGNITHQLDGRSQLKRPTEYDSEDYFKKEAL